MVEEYIVFPMDEELHNFDTFDNCNIDGNNGHLIYYDWLADSATTLHVTHQCEAFIDYTHLGNISITGVGSKEAVIKGQGIVELNSSCNGSNYVLTLQNVIHVPGTWNNLISLG
jgi:hypothetical protein